MGSSIDLGDDGGNWILEAIRMGTLVGVHDGSYKDKLCARICSAGVVLFCTKQRRLATAARAERTDPRTASSYRGELLGGLLMSLILKAASSLIDEKCPPVRLACDNIGAVKSLKDAQVQADVIRCFRAILADVSFDITYEHVLGHQDHTVAWAALTLVQQLNVVADKVAQDYLVRAIHSERFISSYFPIESFRVIMGGQNVPLRSQRRYIGLGGEKKRKLSWPNAILCPKRILI